MDGELRTSLQEQHPEFSSDEIELLLCCHFSSEICAKLASSSDWIQDPSKLLSDLRYLEQWRSEIISGDPRKFEQFTIHREKFSLFTELRGEVQRIVRELREVQPATRIPVSADRLETLWQNLEAVQNATDDGSDTTQTAAYTVWRLLKDEIISLEGFCRLFCGETLLRAQILPFGLHRCDVPNWLKRKGYEDPVEIREVYSPVMEALMAAAPNAVSDTKKEHLKQSGHDTKNAPTKIRDVIDSIGLTIEHWTLKELKKQGYKE